MQIDGSCALIKSFYNLRKESPKHDLFGSVNYHKIGREDIIIYNQHHTTYTIIGRNVIAISHVSTRYLKFLFHQYASHVTVISYSGQMTNDEIQEEIVRLTLLLA